MYVALHQRRKAESCGGLNVWLKELFSGIEASFSMLNGTQMHVHCRILSANQSCAADGGETDPLRHFRVFPSWSNTL